jgi:uncharacterized protein
MNYYLLIYDVIDDYIERRAAFRDEHLRLAKAARDRGELVLGGALAAPVDKAILVFRSSDQTVVEEFVRQDPYIAHGIVSHWEIRPWTVVIE